MTSHAPSGQVLEDIRVPVRIRLSALWASVMFCYVYGDYFGLYQPGSLQHMLEGRMGPLGATTQGILVGTSLMMAIPSVMVFLTLVLPPGPCRWANIILGVLYSAIIVATARGAWAFYVMLGVIEVTMTGLVAWYAWRWPRGAVALPPQAG